MNGDGDLKSCESSEDSRWAVWVAYVSGHGFMCRFTHIEAAGKLNVILPTPMRQDYLPKRGAAYAMCKLLHGMRDRRPKCRSTT